ncbi:MAG: hypothetical protein ACTSW1_07620 [Candidatus Hodarchaeales archaeon]
MNELCKGCNWAGTCGMYLLDFNSDEDTCPCTTCLVKVMCRDKCADRYAYYYWVTELYDHEVKNWRSE